MGWTTPAAGRGVDVDVDVDVDVRLGGARARRRQVCHRAVRVGGGGGGRASERGDAGPGDAVERFGGDYLGGRGRRHHGRGHAERPRAYVLGLYLPAREGGSRRPSGCTRPSGRPPGTSSVPTTWPGGGLTREVVRRLRCAAVVGPANNQLADEGVARALQERGIVWAPDFIVNVGGAVYGVGVDIDGRRARGRDGRRRVDRAAARGVVRQGPSDGRRRMRSRCGRRTRASRMPPGERRGQSLIGFRISSWGHSCAMTRLSSSWELSTTYGKFSGSRTTARAGAASSSVPHGSMPLAR